MRFNLPKPRPSSPNSICDGCPQRMACWDLLDGNPLNQHKRIGHLVVLLIRYGDSMRCQNQVNR